MLAPGEFDYLAPVARGQQLLLAVWLALLHLGSLSCHIASGRMFFVCCWAMWGLVLLQLQWVRISLTFQQTCLLSQFRR